LDFETEKADAEFCHKNFPLTSLFSLIKSSELSATMLANFSCDIEAERETRK